MERKQTTFEDASLAYEWSNEFGYCQSFAACKQISHILTRNDASHFDSWVQGQCERLKRHQFVLGVGYVLSELLYLWAKNQWTVRNVHNKRSYIGIEVKAKYLFRSRFTHLLDTLGQVCKCLDQFRLPMQVLSS